MASQSWTIGSGQDYTDLDDMVSDNFGASAGDDVTARLKEVLDESIEITSTHLGSSGSLHITTDEADHNDGTQGSGYGMAPTTSALDVLKISTVTASHPAFELSWLEFDLSGCTSANHGTAVDQSRSDVSGNDIQLHHLHIYGYNTNGNASLLVSQSQESHVSDPKNVIHHCLFEDNNSTATGGGYTVIETIDSVIAHCTIADCTSVNSSASKVAILPTDKGSFRVYNNIVVDFDNGGSGTHQAYDDNLITGGCVSSDSTAVGRNAVTSAVTADLFTAPGSGDYSLKSGSAAIDIGLYDPADVNIYTDLTGRDRIAQGDTFDAGAYEFVAAGGGFQSAWAYRATQIVTPAGLIT